MQVLIIMYINPLIMVKVWVDLTTYYSFAVSALASKGDTVIAGGYNGVYLSSNYGTSWQPYQTGLPTVSIYSLVISGSNIFTGTNSGFYQTKNNGSNWMIDTTGLKGYYNVSSIVTKGDTILSGVLGSGVFMSINNGSWKPVNKGLSSINVYSLAVSGNNIFAGTNYGAFLSNNVQNNWNSVNNGISNNIITSLLINNNNIFAGTLNGVYLSNNHANNWIVDTTSLNTNYYISALAIKSDTLFAATIGGSINYSINNGNSWNYVNAGLPNNSSINALAISGNNIFAGTLKGVYVSTNKRSSWITDTTGFYGDYNVSSLAAKGDSIFAGALKGVYLSTNNGNNWKLVNNGLPITTICNPKCFITYYGIISLAIKGNNIYAGTNGKGIYFSNNNGTSWNADTTGLMGNYTINALTIKGDTIFAGNSFAGKSNGGVYWSTIKGTSWSSLNNSGLSAKNNVNCIAFDNTFIYIGTTEGGGTNTGYGVYRQLLSGFPTLSVSNHTLNIASASNSKVSFNINSNTTWAINSKYPWLTPSLVSGSDSSIITLTASANPTNNQRIDTITISGSYVASQKVIVTQAAGSPTLSVSTNSLNVAATSNSTASFTINSNEGWSLTSSKTQKWLTPNVTSGSDTALVTLTATDNPTIYQRIDTVTVSGNGVPLQKIIVTQSAGSPTLTISVASLFIAAPSNSTASFTINSNEGWSLISSKTQKWLTPNVTSGSDTALVTLTATDNPTINQRIDTITVSGNGTTSQKIIIIQISGLATLSISKDTLNIGAVANTTRTFTINSNEAWTITNSKTQNWLTPNVTSGSDTSNITLTATGNNSLKQRIDTISIAGNSVTLQKVIVTQAAGSGTGIIDITESDVTLYPIPVIDNLIISFTNPTDKTLLSIFNINGVEIYSATIVNSITTVDMSKYAAGVYVVKIISPDHGIIFRKIIKQ